MPCRERGNWERWRPAGQGATTLPSQSLIPRATKDPHKSYPLFKKCYDQGGNTLFPDWVLGGMHYWSGKLGDKKGRQEAEQLIRAWMPSDPKSVWRKVFLIHNPGYKVP